MQDRVFAPGERVETFRIHWSMPDGSNDPRVREGIDHEAIEACPVGPLPL